MKAKLANALGLDQADRQDVKHAKLLVVVLGEYLLDLLEELTAESEREILSILRDAVKVALSSDAREFEARHGISFAEYLPISAMEASTPRVAKFATVEFRKLRDC